MFLNKKKAGKIGRFLVFGILAILVGILILSAMSFISKPAVDVPQDFVKETEEGASYAHSFLLKGLFGMGKLSKEKAKDLEIEKKAEKGNNDEGNLNEETEKDSDEGAGDIYIQELNLGFYFDQDLPRAEEGNYYDFYVGDTKLEGLTENSLGVVLFIDTFSPIKELGPSCNRWYIYDLKMDPSEPAYRKYDVIYSASFRNREASKGALDLVNLFAKSFENAVQIQGNSLSERDIDLIFMSEGFNEMIKTICERRTSSLDCNLKLRMGIRGFDSIESAECNRE